MSGRRKGFTLVEVMVAMLVLAAAAFSMMSVILSSRKTQVSSDRRQAAAFFGQLLRDTLKNYVIAYPLGTGTPSAEETTRLHDTMVDMLGCTAGSPNCARLAGDSCGTWALDAAAPCNSVTGTLTGTGCAGVSGGHDASQLLPNWFLISPFSGCMRYSVANDSSGGKQVAIRVFWLEPVQ